VDKEKNIGDFSDPNRGRWWIIRQNICVCCGKLALSLKNCKFVNGLEWSERDARGEADCEYPI
jgi:hypothetical protein